MPRLSRENQALLVVKNHEQPWLEIEGIVFTGVDTLKSGDPLDAGDSLIQGIALIQLDGMNHRIGAEGWFIFEITDLAEAGDPQRKFAGDRLRGDRIRAWDGRRYKSDVVHYDVSVTGGGSLSPAQHPVAAKPTALSLSSLANEDRVWHEKSAPPIDRALIVVQSMAWNISDASGWPLE
ncbi:hypothetical protein [Phyllobacterium sp. K27]